MAYVLTTDLGTPKRIEMAEVVTDADPAGAGSTTVDCTNYVPAGTKAVEGWFQMTSSQAADYLAIREYGGTDDRDIARCQVANVVSDGHFLVKLDSSYRFAYYASNARVSGVYIRIWVVYL